MSAMQHVLDALDLETFLVCQNEAEAKELALNLAAELGLAHADVVFVEQSGLGARVRIRSYIHHPGQGYGWLKEETA